MILRFSYVGGFINNCRKYATFSMQHLASDVSSRVHLPVRHESRARARTHARARRSQASTFQASTFPRSITWLFNDLRLISWSPMAKLLSLCTIHSQLLFYGFPVWRSDNLYEDFWRPRVAGTCMFTRLHSYHSVDQYRHYIIIQWCNRRLYSTAIKLIN